MSLSVSAAVVYFIACHGGPADHFATFAENLTNKGYQVQIYATGDALKKFQDRNIKMMTPFSLENISEEEAATELVKKCVGAAVVITDVGHAFDISLQNALKNQLPTSLRLAYYDNAENYVLGGYSPIAAKVMLAAQGVLFSNANLAKEPLYQAPLQEQEVCLAPEKKIGIGYYPIAQAEQIAKRRESEHNQMRTQLLSHFHVTDRGQKILVYAGGNNEEYFTKALPAFLQFLKEASLQKEDSVQKEDSLQADLSHFIFLLQQHPGAKKNNVDGQLVQKWLKEYNQETLVPQFYISELTSDDAQVVADGMLYYQTSMGPQFVLAGIPTIQVGHSTNEDVLVRNELCATATDMKSLMNALTHLPKDVKTESRNATIKQGLGISSEWANRLENAIQNFRPIEN